MLCRTLVRHRNHYCDMENVSTHAYTCLALDSPAADGNSHAQNLINTVGGGGQIQWGGGSEVKDLIFLFFSRTIQFGNDVVLLYYASGMFSQSAKGWKQPNWIIDKRINFIVKNDAFRMTKFVRHHDSLCVFKWFLKINVVYVPWSLSQVSVNGGDGSGCQMNTYMHPRDAWLRQQSRSQENVGV